VDANGKEYLLILRNVDLKSYSAGKEAHSIQSSQLIPIDEPNKDDQAEAPDETNGSTGDFG
jgi:hypothetical protein